MVATKVTPLEQNNVYRFKVFRNSNQTLSGTQVDTVVFDTEDFDNNNNFNNSTGIYTCPVSGYYLFTAHVRVDCTGTATYDQLYIDGEKVTDRNSTAGQQTVLHGTVFKYHAANDQVSCGIYHNGTATIVGSYGEVNFGGFLVTPLN